MCCDSFDMISLYSGRARRALAIWLIDSAFPPPSFLPRADTPELELTMSRIFALSVCMTSAICFPLSSTHTSSLSFSRASIFVVPPSAAGAPSLSLAVPSTLTLSYVIRSSTIGRRSLTIASYVNSCISGDRQSSFRSSSRRVARSVLGWRPSPLYHHSAFEPTNSFILFWKRNARFFVGELLARNRTWGYSLSVAQTVTSFDTIRSWSGLVVDDDDGPRYRSEYTDEYAAPPPPCRSGMPSPPSLGNRD